MGSRLLVQGPKGRGGGGGEARGRQSGTVGKFFWTMGYNTEVPSYHY